LNFLPVLVVLSIDGKSNSPDFRSAAMKQKAIIAKLSFAIIFLICIGFNLPKPAMANGQLIIERPPMPWPQFQPLILEKEEIRTSIDNQIAKTHIRQVWRNNNGMQLEGTFLFPLPMDRASMSDFVLWMDGKNSRSKPWRQEKPVGFMRTLYDECAIPVFLNMQVTV
jgi:hypothetical protein